MATIVRQSPLDYQKRYSTDGGAWTATPPDSGSPAGTGNHILTEASDFLNTEGSDELITEA